MCRKIRCDGESCKVFGFWVYLNEALLLLYSFVSGLDDICSRSQVGQIYACHIGMHMTHDDACMQRQGAGRRGWRRSISCVARDIDRCFLGAMHIKILWVHGSVSSTGKIKSSVPCAALLALVGTDRDDDADASMARNSSSLASLCGIYLIWTCLTEIFLFL